MRRQSITPSITVTIGRYTRQYEAFVTTAPAELDLPRTVMLHEGRFSDVVGLAADPITHHELRARTPARLVLIEAGERGWQEVKYREHQHLLLRADPDRACCEPGSIRRAVRRGRLRAARLRGNGELRFLESWIEQWLIDRLMPADRDIAVAVDAAPSSLGEPPWR